MTNERLHTDGKLKPLMIKLKFTKWTIVRKSRTK